MDWVGIYAWGIVGVFLGALGATIACASLHRKRSSPIVFQEGDVLRISLGGNRYTLGTYVDFGIAEGSVYVRVLLGGTGKEAREVRVPPSAVELHAPARVQQEVANPGFRAPAVETRARVERY